MRTVYTAVCLVALCASAFAQSPASNKAFFAAGTNTITLAPVTASPAELTLLSAPNALKTSSVGALGISVSMECALWTFTTLTATSGGGKQVVTAHAGVEAWVEVNGTKATPGNVVYCDRLQAVGLDITTVCTIPGITGCTVTDTITLDLFQATKNANSFNFFIGPLAAKLHSVVVKGRGIVQCSANGQNVPCPSSVLSSFANAKTAAAVGKRTLVIEEHNNFGVAP